MSGGAGSTRDWDASVYDRVSDPQLEWGRRVVERLALEGDETVLDAGCGTGRVTALLLERLPRGRVIAVDGSPAMAEKARAALPADRVEVRVADLLELELEEPVDAAFSTAVFHWIADRPRLFRRLHAALRPGARLVAQCGGQGNLAGFMEEVEAVIAREPFAAALEDWERPWLFSPPAEAALALADAGFEQVDCWLEPAPVVLDDPRDFLRTVVLAPHLDVLPDELGDELLDRVLERAGAPLTLDYVRLNITATRGDD